MKSLSFQEFFCNRAILEKLTSSDSTMLITASAYGCIDIVKELLDEGIDKSHRDFFGRTALSAAIKKKHQEIVEILK